MSNKVGDLYPTVREKCIALQREWVLTGRPRFKVTHTLRTMDEQLHLYAKGRKRDENGVWTVVDPKQIVTKAPPGKSAHNWGLAFDIAFVGPDPYPDDEELWQAIGAMGESLGLSWGGPRGEGDRFTWDRPHFEEPKWKEVAVLIQKEQEKLLTGTVT